VHTLTWDNGSEFAEHAVIDIALRAKSYFAELRGMHDRLGHFANP
jgi:IS30 family transposase